MDEWIQDITIKNDGKWYFGQAEMFRRQILKILATNMHRREDGSYYIKMGQEENPVIVEDVPYLASGIKDNEIPMVLVFHDLQEMVLDQEMKLIFKGEIPYVTYRHAGDTRLSRGVYWKLSQYFDCRGEDVYIVPPSA